MKSAAFKSNMEVGKKFEHKIQTHIETHSPGQVFRNVRVASLCEFDAIVEDYPLLTFVEIKRYRSDFNNGSIRSEVRKFRKHCTSVVNNIDKRDHIWLPYQNKKNEKKNGETTYFELMLNKLNIQPAEGWRFRMILIVPNAVYHKIVVVLQGYFNKHTQYPNNLIDIDGIPLIVIRESAIETTFS